MMFFVKFFQGLALCELKERNLWWDQPAEQVTEHYVVAEWNDILQFPKDRPELKGKKCLKTSTSELKDNRLILHVLNSTLFKVLAA